MGYFRKLHKPDQHLLPGKPHLFSFEAFKGCENLAEVTFQGNKLKEIKSNTFDGCTLTSLTVPSGVDKIGANAFANNTALKTITFTGYPDIDKTTFAGCTVETVYVPGSSSTFTDIGSGTVYVLESGVTLDGDGNAVKAGYLFKGWTTDSRGFQVPTWEVDTTGAPTEGECGYVAHWTSEGANPGGMKWAFDESTGTQHVYDKGWMSGISGTSFAPNDNTTRGMIVTVLHRIANEPNAEKSGFTDVAEGKYYFEAVNWAASQGVVTGYGNNLFGPEDQITREQMVAVLYRYAAKKGYDVTARVDLSVFTDADQISAYAREAMSWANAMGLIVGTSETTLSPTDKVTRAQMAMLLTRFENIFKKTITA